MAALVSITVAGDVARLRRYEGAARTSVCTHSGIYDTAGVTAPNVAYYVERGANQDARPQRGGVVRRSGRRGGPRSA